jgi:DNA polymerase-3 subunit delta'
MQNQKFTINWPLVGNQQITKYLGQCLEKFKVSGTYIFNGPDNLGKTTMASFFARSLLCYKYREEGGQVPCGECPICRSLSIAPTTRNHEEEAEQAHGDLHIVKKQKDKKNISVEQVRELIKTLNLSSFLNAYKIGIIKHADHLSSEAANALLKTLEEPKDKVVIILIVSDINRIPTTIVSRAQILNFRSVKADVIYDYLVNDYKASRSQAKNLSRLAMGRPALAVKFFEDKDFYELYISRAKVFLNFTSLPVYERFIEIAGLLGKKSKGQEAVVLSRRILEVWQGILRDGLLISYGLGNLIQHQEFSQELKDMVEQIKPGRLVKIYEELKIAHINLGANVNPLLSLENVAASF